MNISTYRLLKLTADEKIVRKQDRSSFIISVAENGYAKTLAFDYLDENWNELLELFRSSSYTLSNLLLKTSDSFNTNYELQRVLEFRRKHADLASASNAIVQVIENVNTNINWMNKNSKKILDWLNENAARS